MNSRVALGTLATCGYSIVATYLPGLPATGTRAVCFEAAAVLCTPTLLSRWFGARAK